MNKGCKCILFDCFLDPDIELLGKSKQSASVFLLSEPLLTGQNFIYIMGNE